MATTPKSAGQPVKIHVALDDIDDELGVDEEREPFTFTLPGDPEPITFTDPTLLGWKQLMTLENPYDMADLCIASEADRKRFLKANLNGRQVGYLTSQFRAHYGLGRSGK